MECSSLLSEFQKKEMAGDGDYKMCANPDVLGDMCWRCARGGRTLSYRGSNNVIRDGLIL